MKIAFSNMDMGKIKYMEKIKTEHKDEFKLEDLIKYSEKVAEELLENINKATGDKKPQNRVSKKLKLGE
jgi:exosome complex RNA-binding protein Rrp42 (RNase PH superfamily)